MSINDKNLAKPFLKWAGGKTQLLNSIEKLLPLSIKDSPFTYIEPFVGSGAVLFWMINKFPNLEKAIINDINSDLTNSYLSIKYDVEELIPILKKWEKEYHSISENEEKKKEYYYAKRDAFNTRKLDQSTQTALFIFLNRTCFNGLYRVNSKNEFNVPIGSYTTPMICDESNLRNVSNLLSKVEILNVDFEKTLDFTTKKTFFYFDPPYKPLNETSSFNSYAKDDFNDSEQIRLAAFCDKLNDLNYKWLLSNSDVKGKNPKNNFFDDLYDKHYISRVNARRNINSIGSKRGQLTELLICNYNIEDDASGL